jgi:hypothetical protein
MSYSRPPTPAAVERALRQESGFGCARCGHPYIEYHHIIPYADEAHFRPEDMVALCGNCHPAVGKLARQEQYEIKASPRNIKENRAGGALEYSKDNLVFKVGGNWFEDTPIILQYQNLPIISCRLDDGKAKVSLNLLDGLGNTIFTVKDNDVDFRVDDLWDFEYAHNWAVARYGPRDIALRIDFRKDDATIEGNIWLGPHKVKLGADETTLPGNNIFRGNRMVRNGIGMLIR